MESRTTFDMVLVFALLAAPVGAGPTGGLFGLPDVAGSRPGMVQAADFRPLGEPEAQAEPTEADFAREVTLAFQYADEFSQACRDSSTAGYYVPDTVLKIFDQDIGRDGKPPTVLDARKYADGRLRVFNAMKILQSQEPGIGTCLAPIASSILGEVRETQERVRRQPDVPERFRNYLDGQVRVFETFEEAVGTLGAPTRPLP